ncbi:hypothetical protein ACLKA6_007680 [Drosophila palustris]
MSVWTTASSAGAGLETLNATTSSSNQLHQQLPQQQQQQQATPSIKPFRQSAGNLNLSTFVQPIGNDITTSVTAQHFQHVVAAAVAAATTIATGQQQQQLNCHPFNNNNNNNNNNFGSSSGSSYNGNSAFAFKRSSFSNSASQLPTSSQNLSKFKPLSRCQYN